MIPGVGSLTNSGSLPISGGHASASNGDSVFDGRAQFGGITRNQGIHPAWIATAVVGVFLVMMNAKS